MKVSRKHLLYIIDKLLEIAKIEQSEYEITADTFSDERKHYEDLLSKPYALQAKNLDELKVLAKYFNYTGRGIHEYDENTMEHLNHICLFKEKHGDSISVSRHRYATDLNLNSKFKLIDFEDVKHEIEEYISEHEGQQASAW